MGLMYITGFVLNIIENSDDIEENIPRNLDQDEGITSLATIVISLFSVVILGLTTTLCVFHINICCKNETTRENLKGLKEENESAATTCKLAESRFEPRMLV